MFTAFRTWDTSMDDGVHVSFLLWRRPRYLHFKSLYTSTLPSWVTVASTLPADVPTCLHKHEPCRKQPFQGVSKAAFEMCTNTEWLCSHWTNELDFGGKCAQPKPLVWKHPHKQQYMNAKIKSPARYCFIKSKISSYHLYQPLSSVFAAIRVTATYICLQ